MNRTASLLLVAVSACSSSSASEVQKGAAPDAGDSWATGEQALFARYCVECHSGSDPQMRDYTQLANVVRDEDIIRCGVAPEQPASWGCPSGLQPRQFPISDSTGQNPKPTDSERDRIVAWIDAGCP